MTNKTVFDQFSTNSIKPILALNKIATRTIQQLAEQNLNTLQIAVAESNRCLSELPNAKENIFVAYGKMFNDLTNSAIDNAKKSIEPFFASTAQFSKLFEDNITTASNIASAASNINEKKATATTK